MTDLIERPPSEVARRASGAAGEPHQPLVPRQHESRPESRPDQPIKRDTLVPLEDTVAETYLTTQTPQRPQSTPRIRIEVDGRVVEGLEGQTILEV